MCFYKPVKCCIVRLFIIIVATPLILLALFLVVSTLVIATIIVNVVSFIAFLSLLLLYCCRFYYCTAVLDATKLPTHSTVQCTSQHMYLPMILFSLLLLLLLLLHCCLGPYVNLHIQYSTIEYLSLFHYYCSCTLVLVVLCLRFRLLLF